MNDSTADSVRNLSMLADQGLLRAPLATQSGRIKGDFPLVVMILRVIQVDCLLEHPSEHWILLKTTPELLLSFIGLLAYN